MATAEETGSGLRKNCRCVLIGSSLGGTQTLFYLLPELCRRLSLPILIAQHMAESFTRNFALELDRRCRQKSRYRVFEATHGLPLQPFRAYVAPGDVHMLLRGNHIVLDADSPKENGCRPAVDPLFRTAAEAFYGQALAIVLTGMGSDGTKGAARIRAAGGYVIAQDQESSVVWGMPRSVVVAGLADAVLPVSEIAPVVAGLIADYRNRY